MEISELDVSFRGDTSIDTGMILIDASMGLLRQSVGGGRFNEKHRHLRC